MTRIVNISTLPDRDARIDLQPSDRGPVLFSVDPKTGMQLEEQYVQVDSVGNPIETDAEGLPQLGIRTPVLLSTTTPRIKYNRLSVTLDTTIGELTVGARDSVLSDENFGSLCSPQVVDDNALLDEINRLNAEIARLNGLLVSQDELNATIDQLRSELGELTDELEELISTVEDLRECNTTLESAAESRDQAVQELSEDTHRLTLENAYLRSEVLRLGGRLSNVQTSSGTGGTGGSQNFGDGATTGDSLTRVRSIGALMIDQLNTRDQQNLSAEIAIVRTSTATRDLHESLDLILATLPPEVLENYEDYVTELETILGRSFVYAYERQRDNIIDRNNRNR